MKIIKTITALIFIGAFFCCVSSASADTLALTSGNNATTTPSVATSITGFQIVGNAASTTPVKIHVTNGTVHVSTVSGVTISGNDSATLNLSGTVADLNTALSTLTYTRASTGTDTLEVALVNSSQIYFPTNGHVYQYVASSLDWNHAKLAAEALTAYGATGYLVTITSSDENNFVKARLSGDAWIGASDATSEGVWKWVTGPENGTQFWQGAGAGSTVGGNYASWNGGEPNDSGGSEDCGEEYVSNGTWNDLPCSGTTVSGYVAEFGSVSDPATVVSKNVSIVTADVPAVTTLSPASGATDVGTTTNFVIGFSKSVTAGTGNILIKKSSDDSTVESVDVTGGAISGGGSNTITITSGTTFDEGSEYYVIVPNTAFKDSSNNYFAGIVDSTTWTFSVPDRTAPVISAVQATSTATTTGTISWTTNEVASSKVVYSAGLTFASSTSETDTSVGVTSHSKAINNLIACTSYNYKVVSADASGNYATSTSNLFTTSGCSGGAEPLSATTTSVTVSSSATSTLTDTGRTLSVVTPANFTATSSSVVIQIKAQTADPVLDSIGKPTNLSSAASVVFEVTALIDNETTLNSFDSPVTITYSYTDSDVEGLNESTLVMYHYHNGAWERLNDCSVDTGANTITCSTPSFSTFAIFGTPISNSVSSNSATSSGQLGTIYGCKDPKASNYEYFAASKPELCVYNNPSSEVAPSSLFSRDLKIGSKGEDVRNLQQFLNKNGFTVSSSGLGSMGNETINFGQLTRSSLIRFQKSKNISPAIGYFGSKTRGVVNSY